MKGSSERLSFWGHAEKKVLSVIALSAIGASALAGCGSSEKAPENRAQSAQTAATAETASSATPTANPSIEAPADKKTSQPERSRSTDKATEIPSFPASPTQSSEQQSTEKARPGEKKLSAEDNEAFRTQVDEALKNRTKINVLRGLLVVPTGEDGKSTAYSNLFVGDEHGNITGDVSPDKTMTFYVQDQQGNWSTVDLKTPGSYRIDEQGNKAEKLPVQKVEFYSREQNGADSKLGDVYEVRNGKLTVVKGNFEDGVWVLMASSVGIDTSSKGQTDKAAYEATHQKVG
jgi:lipoprotein